MIHLSDGDQLRLVGSCGLPEQWASAPAVPVTSTLGGLVVAEGRPVVITDVGSDVRVPRDAPGHAVGGLAYACFPIRDADGQVAGVCAVFDYQTRSWAPEQLTAVDEGAQACAAFVVEQLSHARTDRARRLLDALLDSLQSGVAACDADGRLVFSNAANRQLNGDLPDDVDLRGWARQRLAENPAATLPPAAMPLMRALDGERLHKVEVAVKRPDERPSMLLADARPIVDAGHQRCPGDGSGRRRAGQRRPATEARCARRSRSSPRYGRRPRSRRPSMSSCRSGLSSGATGAG
ncbi:GAF domain-containing protein [Micromonosporaceae bacterium Da 78-11]